MMLVGWVRGQESHRTSQEDPWLHTGWKSDASQRGDSRVYSRYIEERETQSTWKPWKGKEEVFPLFRVWGFY